MNSSLAQCVTCRTRFVAPLKQIAALGGQVDVCRWLLQQGARTEHMRFGSILSQVLHYGGSLSFQEGISTFGIVRLLQNKEERDIIDCHGTIAENCLYYGPNDILAWLLAQSSSLGYQHTPEDKAQLAINIARNTQHNGAELVKTVLADLDPEVALRVKNANGVTLLHRIASRIGGALGHEAQGMEKATRFLDAGPSLLLSSLPERESIAHTGWRSLLHALDLTTAGMHAITGPGAATPATPMIVGIRTLVFVWVGSTSQLITALSAFLFEWLSDLKRLGVKFLSYGQEEKRLQDHGLVSKDFQRRKRDSSWKARRKLTDLADDRSGVLSLVNLRPSISAEKWQFWWSEPTDEFSGDFWKMCERPPATTPGAWDEGTFDAI